VAKINISFPSISIGITFSGSYGTYLHKNILIYGNGEMFDMFKQRLLNLSGKTDIKIRALAARTICLEFKCAKLQGGKFKRYKR
jgi:hypothetical protein